MIAVDYRQRLTGGIFDGMQDAETGSVLPEVCQCFSPDGKIDPAVFITIDAYFPVEDGLVVFFMPAVVVDRK